MKLLGTAWEVLCFVVGALLVIIAATVGLGGDMEIGPLTLTPEQRTLLYAWMAAETGRRLWLRVTSR